MRVFVFGSNREGRHGKGAAKTAVETYGAVYGQAEGRQGASYAIVTKELRRWMPAVTAEEVEEGVKSFLAHAADNPQDSFVVTRIGCGLAGFREDEIAPMFAGAPSNCILPDGWRVLWL